MTNPALPAAHMALLYVTLTHHSANFQTVHGVVTRVVLASNGQINKAGIPRRRHGHRHRQGHPRRLPREDRREDVGVSRDFPVQLATEITSFSTSRTRTRILAD